MMRAQTILPLYLNQEKTLLVLVFGLTVSFSNNFLGKSLLYAVFIEF